LQVVCKILQIVFFCKKKRLQHFLLYGIFHGSSQAVFHQKPTEKPAGISGISPALQDIRSPPCDVLIVLTEKSAGTRQYRRSGKRRTPRRNRPFPVPKAEEKPDGRGTTASQQGFSPSVRP
jgi:hypothetical protein